MADRHATVECNVNFGSHRKFRMEFSAKDVEDLEKLNGRYLNQVRGRVYEVIRLWLYSRHDERHPPFRPEMWERYQISVLPVLSFSQRQDERGS